MKFQAMQRPINLRQTQALEGGTVKKPLISQIMDGEDGGGALRLTVEQGGHQPGLPIIAVNEFRSPVKHLRAHADSGDGLAKQHEAIGVVAPITSAGVGVGVAFAGKVIRGIHQIGREFTVWQASDDNPCGSTRTGQAQVTQSPEFSQLPQGPGIGGDDQAGVIAQVAQGGGQGSGDIGQTAGLDQGVRLAAGKEEAALVFRRLRGYGEVLP